jgi:hypothetical protein
MSFAHVGHVQCQFRDLRLECCWLTSSAVTDFADRPESARRGKVPSVVPPEVPPSASMDWHYFS